MTVCCAGGGTWPVGRKGKGGVALRQAGMGVVGWMCNGKVEDRVPGGELREGLGMDDVVLILRQGRLRWCGRVLRGEGTGWVGRCVECEVEGSGREVDGEARGGRLCKRIAKHVD